MEQQSTYVKLKAIREVKIEINLSTLLVVFSSSYCQYVYMHIYIIYIL